MPLSKLDSMLSNNNSIDYDELAQAIARAMKHTPIILDKEVVGGFVEQTILKGAY
jgi:hypothetical protein